MSNACILLPTMRSHVALMLLLMLVGCNVRSITAQNWQSWLSCQTPQGADGRCVHYKDCVYAAEFERTYGNNLPDNIREFLTNSRCDGADRTKLNICCHLSYIQPMANSVIEATTSPPPPPSTSQRSPVVNRDVSRFESSDNVIFTSNRGNYEASLNPRAVQMLNSFRCGVDGTYRVSNANKTAVGQYPWMALLRYDNSYQPFQCGGSLISPRYVITAAHCMVELNNKLIGVRLGEHTINTEKDCIRRGRKQLCYQAQDFGIDRIIPHPQYNRRRAVNDVGLIRLNRDAKFEGIVAPICLPLTNRAAQLSTYPDKFTLAGWGTTKSNAPSNELVQADILPKSRSYCQSIFRKSSIKLEHICAGGENQVDSCKGDSGGPLFATVLYDRTVRYVIFGIISFGVLKCGDINSYPGVYTNVVQFMPWITEQLAN